MNNLNAGGCGDNPKYHALDFWIGDWNVYSGKDLAGTNKIEAVLSSCAIIENWKEPEGEGKSFFYFYPVSGQWKQVWVTDAGYVKEKSMVFANDHGVRFQGRVQSKNGTMILDRTTLTPSAGGTVRQVIEQSKDHGKNWITVFDAVYKRKSSS